MGTNFTLIAACIAAFAALIAASMSAYVALKGKDTDFKNDYYKRMIDRRLLAYEQLESFMVLFNRRSPVLISTSVGRSKQELYQFFLSDEEFEAFYTRVQEVSDKTLWVSHDILTELYKLHMCLAAIVNGMGVQGQVFAQEQKLEVEKLIRAGIEHDNELRGYKLRISSLIRKELVEIADVKKFFEGLKRKVTLI
ncbi:hypothetical protein Q5H92_22985 [Hymenobacter sp. M29]|uniref:Phage abortive infection protein n=1 Tax=Hymenobacter mellowenesis TaxID=3063995 RepID=A0ABT9AH94_9BACT|nr:hypothetical protein [Hymenobacter sp. M29]MDO7849248.1 hypothetical protein [Hymenobacter sp. M29]